MAQSLETNPETRSMYKNKKELTASFEKYPAHIDKNAFKVILQKIK